MNGVISCNTVCNVTSPIPWLNSSLRTQLMMPMSTAPARAPTKLTYRKSSAACPAANSPVRATAIPYLKPIRPLASLIKLSPATKCSTFFGIGTCSAIPSTAIASVGASSAARATAAASGIGGTRMWMRRPMRNIVANTSTTALLTICPRNAQSARWEKWRPSLYSSGAMNSSMNQSVATGTCTLITSAIISPRTIWIIASGTNGKK